MIVLVCGLPGSGKSYFAARLAKSLDAHCLSSDALRMRRIKHRTYSDREKMRVYRELYALMERAVRRNKALVIDATFYRKRVRRAFVKTLQNQPHAWIEVTAPERAIRKRLQRPRTTSEANWEVYLKIRKQWEPIEEKHLRLSSLSPVRKMISRAKRYLASL